jgi:hypothetical protein
MKNNTKIRLHLSKNLFESIAKEVLAESKKMNMSGGAYTEAVKMPKKAKVDELFGLGGPKAKYKVGQQVKVKGAKGDTEGRETFMYITKVLSTDKDMGSKYQAKDKGGLNQAKYEFHDDQVISETKKMEEGEQGSKENIKVGVKVHPHGQPERVMTVVSPDGGFGGKVQVEDEKGNKASFDAEDLELVGVMKEVDAVGDTNKMRKMYEMSSKEKMKKGLYKEDEMEEMQINVAEEDMLNEIDPGTIDWSVVAAGLGAIGLTPFLIDKIHNLWKKKFPKSFEKAQSLSKTIDRQASGNEPGDKDRQIKTGQFESTKLNELRKKAKK